MTANTNDSSRLGGSLALNPDDQERLPYGSLLPEDFPKRLERLKEASGLSWSGLAGAIGVDYKQMYKWRKGTEPSGGAMHALYKYASRIPGGLNILMGDGFQMTFFKERPAANDLPLRLGNMKDTSRENEGNIPEDSPVWPPATCTPEQRKLIRKGVRIWAKVAIRSYMRKQEAGSQAEDGGGEEAQ